MGFFKVTGPMPAARDVVNFRANAAGVDHIVFQVSDLPAAIRRVQDAGVVVDTTDPTASPEVRAAGNITLVRFNDPEGNLVGLSQAPPS